MLPIRTILHPTDFSKHSDYAFRLACSFAQAHGAKIHVLHIARGPVIAPVEGVIPPEPERYKEELTEKLNQMQGEDPNILVEHQLVFVGDPAAEICRVAHAIKAELIVMGTHGRTGLGRLLMGSVAAKVVREAPCPVVTVKIPLSETYPAEEVPSKKRCSQKSENAVSQPAMPSRELHNMADEIRAETAVI
jgi:nucleotide-binding universal stress UspA family protein